MNKFLAFTGLSIAVIALILVVVFAPFATIFALNTLFGLGIAYTFYTWLSVVILNILVLGSWNNIKWGKNGK